MGKRIKGGSIDIVLLLVLILILSGSGGYFIYSKEKKYNKVVEELSSKISESKLTIQKLKEEIKDDSDKTKAEVKVLKGELKEEKDNLSSLDQKLKEEKAKLEALDKQSKEEKAKLEDLGQQSKEEKAKLAALEKQSKEEKAKLDNLDKQSKEYFTQLKGQISSVDDKVNELTTNIDSKINDIEDQLSKQGADMVKIKRGLATIILPSLRDQRNKILEKFTILIKSGCYTFNNTEVNQHYKDKYDYNPGFSESGRQGAYKFNRGEPDCSYTVGDNPHAYKGSYLNKLKDIDKKNMCCGYNLAGYPTKYVVPGIEEYLEFMYKYIYKLNEYIEFFEDEGSDDIQDKILEYKEFNQQLLDDFIKVDLITLHQ